jgi:hypothetical protein
MWGEGANRTYANLPLLSGPFLRAKRVNKIAGPVPCSTASSAMGRMLIPRQLEDVYRGSAAEMYSVSSSICTTKPPMATGICAGGRSSADHR